MTYNASSNLYASQEALDAAVTGQSQVNEVIAQGFDRLEARIRMLYLLVTVLSVVVTLLMVLR